MQQVLTNPGDHWEPLGTTADAARWSSHLIFIDHLPIATQERDQLTQQGHRSLVSPSSRPNRPSPWPSSAVPGNHCLCSRSNHQRSRIPSRISKDGNAARSISIPPKEADCVRTHLRCLAARGTKRPREDDLSHFSRLIISPPSQHSGQDFRRPAS